MEDWEEVKKGPGWVRMLAIEADGEDCKHEGAFIPTDSPNLWQYERCGYRVPDFNERKEDG